MRLFVALEIAAETREALASLITALKPQCPSARWVRPEAMHITVKFIGHTPGENLPEIREILGKPRSPEPIEMQFRGLGFFPNEKRPRIFWCGVQASPNAAILAAELDAALAPLGVEPETHPFRPHLTLARFKEDRGGKQPEKASRIVKVLSQMPTRDFGSLKASEYHLFESTTKPTGAEYTKLSTFHFTEAPR